MAIITIQLNFSGMNTSAQVGDTVYYSTPPTGGGFIGGFNTSEVSNTNMLGKITLVNQNSIVVEYDDNFATAPPVDSYISFAKDKRVNTSSLVGYYANVEFVNDSTKPIELFSIGSDVSASSK